MKQPVDHQEWHIRFQTRNDKAFMNRELYIVSATCRMEHPSLADEKRNQQQQQKV